MIQRPKKTVLLNKVIYSWLLIVGLGVVSLQLSASAESERLNDVSGSQVQIASRVSDIVKPETDTRLYRSLELKNGLKVLLISDPKAEKSAASLSVSVGSGDDPVDRNGLAHFLEHMLFLGTEKYPVAGEYQDFISGHGGSHNAYTSIDHTNYFFDIENPYFDSALERFAQFFIAPLFDEKYVERERNAVHSEYSAKYADEFRRARDVYRELVAEAHPLGHFSVGNLDTLALEGPRKLQDDLNTFYTRHYSANRMALVVLSHQSLEYLQERVVSVFSAVASRSTEEPVAVVNFIPESQLPLEVQLRPRKEKRELSFIFQVPDTKLYFREKPTAYIGFFLGHEGKGSLLSLLKSKDWATGLSAGRYLEWRGGSTFGVSIALTEQGESHVDEIQSLLLAAIDLLKSSGVDRWRYEELAKLGRQSFAYSDAQQPISEVMQLANKLQRIPVQEILQVDHLYQNFDAELIQRYLAKLSPSNMVRVQVSPAAVVDKTSRYYQTEYSVRPLSLAAKTVVSKRLVAELKLPKRNRFIAEDFTLYPAKVVAEKVGDAEAKSQPNGVEIPTDWAAVPVLIEGAERFKLWYLNDDVFELPKGFVKIRYYLPAVADSVDGAVQANLYAGLITEMLNEVSYSAAMAGLNFSVSPHSRGIDLSFSGYSDSLPALVKTVLSEIKSYNRSARIRKKVHAQSFETLRDDLLRGYKNERLSTPYRRLLRVLPSLLYSPYWSSDAQETATLVMGLKQYEATVGDFFSGASAEMFVFGNYREKDAQRLAKPAKKLLSSGRDAPSLVANRVVDLSRGGQRFWKVLPSEHSDSGVIYYIQAASESVAESARLMLLEQMLATPAYTSLRTEKQLGYIVFAALYPIRDVQGLMFVVQSPSVDANTIYTEVDSFLLGYKSDVLNNFERDKLAVLAGLRQKPKTQAERAGEFWDGLLRGDTDFTRKQRLISAVEGLVGADLTEYYGKLLSSQSARVIVATEPPSADALVGSAIELIGTDDQLKKALPSYKYP